MARVLVVEDERKVLAGLERGLRAAGYEVITACTGIEGERHIAGETVDCIILDWMLPGRDGLTILRDLRSAGCSVPVLLLTARDAIDDRVVGLDSGANDYLVKPFAFAELLARLRAILRHSQPDRETVLRAGRLELDLLERRALLNKKELSLTHREFEVLEYLTRHKNQTVTRDMLTRDVWKEPGPPLTNVIDVFIGLLRRKLTTADGSPRIMTLRGVGYSLRE